MSAPVHAAASPPYLINFQGRLTNVSGTALTGTYDMQFKLWTASSGGSLIWSESHTAANSNAVTVSNGMFTTMIGGGTLTAGTSVQNAVTNNTTLYLEVTVGAETFTTRSQFGSSAYALNSDTLDGLDSSAFGQLTGTNSWTGAQSVNVASNANEFQVKSGTTNLFNVDSTNSIITLGTSDTTGAVLVLDVKSNAGDPTGSSAVIGAMYYNSNLGKFRCYQVSGWTDCITTIPTTTLQTAYAASTGGTTPEIKVGAGGAVTIQDADSTISGTLFSVTQSNSSNIGAAIFSANSDGSFSLGYTGSASILSSNTAGAISLGILNQTTTLPGNISSTGTFSSTGATALFKPSSAAANAFQVQNSSSVVLLSADTSANKVSIGSNTTDTTNQILLQLDSWDTFGDTTSCTTTTNQGGLYYNTKTNAVRGCINGGWEDMVSTASLGLQLFGVVPDSGIAAGDIYGVTSATAGPCKVSVGASLQTVSWTACTAFSGGRKVIVTASTMGTTNALAGGFQHLCLTGTNSQPTLFPTTGAAETANLGTVSFPSSTAPILCLADIKFAAANNTISEIYDTRTYTTTDKTFVALNSAAGLSSIVIYSGTKGVVATVGIANSAGIAGVIVATNGTASTNTINAVMATGGPAAVKATAGTLNNYIFTSTTAGYAVSVGSKPTEGTGTIYNLLGNVRTAFSSACAINSDSCAGSLMTDIDKR